MPPELALPAAFALAAVVTWMATPLAVVAAHRTAFMDKPAGYKGHGAPTPYLGGSAVMAGILVAGLAFGGAAEQFAALAAGAGVLWVVGTLDDRHGLSPFLRLAVELVVAGLLHTTGNGWSVFESPVLDLVLTCVWVIGVVNAVNLMDNMDGAAATVVGVSAAGAATLAALGSDLALAAVCLAIAGACAGFLPHNLARPARIFMGDGGSMPLGLLLAGVTMTAASEAELGIPGVLAAALIVGLAILDTTLVSVSRRRGGRPLLLGGRDHLTHRLRSRLKTPQAVAGHLALFQAGLCVLAVVLSQVGALTLTMAGVIAVVLGARAIWYLDRWPWFDRRFRPHVSMGAQGRRATDRVAPDDGSAGADGAGLVGVAPS